MYRYVFYEEAQRRWFVRSQRSPGALRVSNKRLCLATTGKQLTWKYALNTTVKGVLPENDSFEQGYTFGVGGGVTQLLLALIV